MLDRLLLALVRSKNEAADDVLLEALRLGTEAERQGALDALLQRGTGRGLGGILSLYERLPDSLQLAVLRNVKALHHALRESGRGDQTAQRLAAMKLIAQGRQGKLAYVLSENLHGGDDALGRAAAEAMVALARWVAAETRALQRGERGDDAATLPPNQQPPERTNERPAAAHVTPTAPDPAAQAYRELMDQRPEIEAAVARAMDVHRGRHGQELLRAGLLLCDWPGSKTLGILNTHKHGGQSAMVRRLQQPPASEHVDAFLLGASHAGLRSHFGAAFSHVDASPVLDAVLRRTHWLKDHALQLCMHQVTRGVWWGEPELARDIERRAPDEAALIGEWLAASGSHDTAQDERMEGLRLHAKDSFPARLRLLRIAAGRRRGASVLLLRNFLADPDERLVRLAAREIVRRKPVDFENILLQLMTAAPASVRRVISRAIGQAGFEHFWDKFDRLDKPTRRRAGLAMLKLMPDGVQRLRRRLAGGPVEQRLKAMQVAQELGLTEQMRDLIVQLCADPDPRLRSKAVASAGAAGAVGPDVLVERLLNDPDPRVRANTVEVLEARGDRNFLPMIVQRARAGTNRERANAVRALHRLRLVTVGPLLMAMLRDPRPEHRVSGLWLLRQIGWWPLLGEVGRLAKQDSNLRVRRYALGVLKGVAELAAAGPGPAKVG